MHSSAKAVSNHEPACLNDFRMKVIITMLDFFYDINMIDKRPGNKPAQNIAFWNKSYSIRRVNAYFNVVLSIGIHNIYNSHNAYTCAVSLALSIFKAQQSG